MTGRAPRGAVWAALICVAVLGGVACKTRRGPQALVEQPALGNVAVARASRAHVEGTQINLDGTRVAARAKAALAGSGIFSASSNAAAQANVTIDLDVLGQGTGNPPEIGVKVRLKVEVRPAGSAAARYADDGAAIGQMPLEPGSAGDVASTFQRLAERTVEDLAQAYVARKRLWRADDRDVAKALASEDNELRIAAIRVVGVRRLRQELPAILRFLGDDDEATRDAALGAVVAMGERSAIKALAESHQMRDSYEMGKVLDAVASLGGREAKEYLSFVAETHDDPDIRSMAKEAGERLRKREASQAPTP